MFTVIHVHVHVHVYTHITISTEYEIGRVCTCTIKVVWPDCAKVTAQESAFILMKLCVFC